MRIVFAGHKERGVACLRALIETGHTVVAVIAHASRERSSTPASLAALAADLRLPLVEPADVNDADTIAWVRGFESDLMVLAGYGPILHREVIELPALGCINLHAGKLPQYRGSSPMNWVLINGEREFTLSIIRVAPGVDTGDVLIERTFPIGPQDTIADLHRQANIAFPEMLVEVVSRIQAGTMTARRQDEADAGYYPLRFPDDGLVLWDLASAEQVHNRVRALTEPYPGAFSILDGERVKLLQTSPSRRHFYGEPGRVYEVTENGLLVCAADRCLWVRHAIFERSGDDATKVIRRYQRFTGIRDLIVNAASVARS